MEDKKEDALRLKTSLMEAYMGSAFECKDDAIVFKDYKTDKSYRILLSEAARILYEFRRDRVNVNDFRTKLNVLYLNLKGDCFKDLSEEEEYTFQLWRLYRFDFFEKDIDEQKHSLLTKSAENLNVKSEYYSNDRLSIAIIAEKSKKAQEEHQDLLSKLSSLCNTIKVNRVAYSAAFSMGDIELVAKHKAMPLRPKPLIPLDQSIKSLRSIAQKKSTNPFELTEL